MHGFAYALVVGVIVGTYSSVGIAAQVLVSWEQKDTTRFIRRIMGRESPEVATATPWIPASAGKTVHVW